MLFTNLFHFFIYVFCKLGSANYHYSNFINSMALEVALDDKVFSFICLPTFKRKSVVSP